MRIENRLGLPDPIVAAIANDEYSRGDADISVSQLIAPPRQVALMAQHADALVEDASDRIFSLLGKAVHEILARAGDSAGALREQRLSVDILGWKVSGAFDHLALVDGILSDYKITSVWQVIFADQKSDWVAQTNCYAELARSFGYDIKALHIVAIIRDWSKRKASIDPEYPQQQVAVLPMPVWPREQAVAYLTDRIRLHQAARKELPACSDEEVWRKPPTWAVMKPGVKRAVRVLPSLNAARLVMQTGQTIVERPGEATRCQAYCAVSFACRQWQAEKGQTSANADQ